MKKRILSLVFFFFFFVSPPLLYAQSFFSSPHSQKSIVTITAPQVDTSLSGDFVIKGTATGNSESIRVVLTDTHDRRQKPLKSYLATYNEKKQLWSVPVKNGDLIEGQYTIRVQVQNASGDTTYAFSSFLISPTLPKSS
ncbi:hypothetical protein BH11PAT1_BH11PAT1_6470 [soil metagenome]